MLLDFKTFYKATVIKTVVAGLKTDIDQWNRTEGPEINSYISGQLICDNSARPFNGERTIFSTDGAGTTRLPHAKE